MRRVLSALAVCVVVFTPAGASDLTKLTPKELFAKADRDGDGRLTPEEFQATVYPSPKHAPKLFKKADKDGDGKLTLAEMTAALDSIAWWKLSRKSPADQFRAADKDGDGRLSLEEFQAVDPHKNHAEAHFKKFDKDGDGKLKFEEFQAFLEAELKDRG